MNLTKLQNPPASTKHIGKSSIAIILAINFEIAVAALGVQVRFALSRSQHNVSIGCCFFPAVLVLAFVSSVL